jgi:hypothetical protein
LRLTATPRFGGLPQRDYDDVLGISFFHDDRGHPFVLVRREGADQTISLDHYRVHASRGTLQSTAAIQLQHNLGGKA